MHEIYPTLSIAIEFLACSSSHSIASLASASSSSSAVVAAAAATSRREANPFQPIKQATAMASTMLRPCCTPATAASAQSLPHPARSSFSSKSLSWSGRVAAAPFLANSVVRVSHRQARLSTVCMVLPAGDTTVETPKVNWEARAVKSFSMAELEARKLKYPNTGTESLLLGILTEGTSEAARFLRRNGVTLFGAKEEIIKLLGKADMYYFSAEHPALTSSAQKALAWAVDPKNRPEGAHGDELSTTMLVLGIWAQKGCAGQKVLATLGINDDKIAELAATMKNSPSKRGSYQQLVEQ